MAYCNLCGDCCKNFSNQNGVILFPEDIKRISHKLGLTNKEFIHNYSYEELLDTELGEITVFFLKDIKGQCVFLSQDNQCTIHEIKPAQCEGWPRSDILNVSELDNKKNTNA